MSKKQPTEEAYAELQQAYDFYNAELFEGELPPCLITFQRQKRTFGYFSKARFGNKDARSADEIALNPEYFVVVPMIEVLQTLVHEMTHLWQAHFGKPSRTCYHNTEWAEKMEGIGLMPSDTGMPGGKRVGQSMGDYPIAGGRFELSTKRLLASGFAISWFDRYPAATPEKFIKNPQTVFSPTPGPADSNGGVVEDDDDGVLAIFAAACAMPPALSDELVDNQKRKDENRSNRIKYTCLGCKVNVWGKPKLRIACADCGTLFAESAASAEELVPD